MAIFDGELAERFVKSFEEFSDAVQALACVVIRNAEPEENDDQCDPANVVANMEFDQD